MFSIQPTIEALRHEEGLPTGIEVIDDYLVWSGLPKGDLVLFHSQHNAKAVQLWIQAAKTISCQAACEARPGKKQQVAWISVKSDLLTSNLLSLTPAVHQFNLVGDSMKSDLVFEALADLIKSERFVMIGCSLHLSSLCSQHLQYLKALCIKKNCTLVLLSPLKHLHIQPIFPLIIDCQTDFYTVRRATLRPTPLVISDTMLRLPFSEAIENSQLGYLC